MPVILRPEALSAWLEFERCEAADLASLLAPYAADAMEAFAVSRLVNSPANDRPECVEPE